jgi:hypothetical protein
MTCHIATYTLVIYDRYKPHDGMSGFYHTVCHISDCHRTIGLAGVWSGGLVLC